MFFTSSKKFFSFSRCSNFCNFFPFLPHFPDSERQMEVESFMILWIGLHKLANVIVGITEKPLYITSSNLVRKCKTNKGIFLNLFRNLKNDWPLVSDPFCFKQFCPLKWTEFERKIKLTFLRFFDNPLSKYFIFRLSCTQWLFWVIYQIEKGLYDWLLVHIFCKFFPWKYSLFNTLLLFNTLSGQSFDVITFFLLKISNKMCCKFLFRQLVMP